MMTLTGILERSLGGFTCLRGFASIKELAKHSRAEFSYQRELNEQHIEEIKHYFGQREYLFFPEIILGHRLASDAPIALAQDESQLLNIGEKKNYPIDIALTEAKSRKGVFKNLKLASFTIEKESLLLRIDGNHRLSAIDQSDERDYQEPICLILFSDSDVDNKQQSVIFHYINSRGVPLTLEENLLAIFQKNRFSNDEIQRHFGKSFLFAKDLFESVDEEHIPHIAEFCKKEKCRCSLLKNITELLNEHLGENCSAATIKSKIHKVEDIIANSEDIKNHLSVSLLTVMCIFAVKDNGKWFTAFINWIKGNRLYQLQNINPQSMIDLFEQIYSNEIKIFVAMPYYDDSTVDDYNASIEETCTELSAQHGLNVQLFPIMRVNAPTGDLIQDIFQKIDRCSIFIADITTNNANVLYEFGYAKGKGKDYILLLNKDKNPTPPKSDYHNELRHEFQGYQNLKAVLKTQIEAVLKERRYF